DPADRPSPLTGDQSLMTNDSWSGYAPGNAPRGTSRPAPAMKPAPPGNAFGTTARTGGDRDHRYHRRRRSSRATGRGPSIAASPGTVGAQRAGGGRSARAGWLVGRAR